MRTGPRRARKSGLLVGVTLFFLFLFSLPADAGNSPEASEPILGRIVGPEGGRVVVRRELCRCQPLAKAPDVLLLTVGTESRQDGEVHFHPLASLAFDRTLGEGEAGQWMAMWVFGPSPAGWRRTLRSLLPFPVGAPRASEDQLERLKERLAEIRQDLDGADLQVPDPVVHLGNLGRSSRSQGVWGGLRRGLSWANVMNPAQLIFRSYLLRRKDRRERSFQRTYLAVQWLLDLEFDGKDELAWLATVNDLRFHLLRNRSFYGRWVEHADALELVYNYESDVRRQLGKTSSWLQSAANEHFLRYQPIYRYTENGAGIPLGGVLYYDPRLRPPDTSWWHVSNPFDLPYNPHRHPKVQRLARLHPEELIPLAVYTFQTNLALRPIIAIDFFAPGNPHTRETTHQLMLLAKQWLVITTGALTVERIPYRLVAWAANKKGYTFLVDKSSRQGIEELRVALEADLYFDPALRPQLMERSDQRVLNPLVKAGAVEARLAHIQYESLRARQAQALCRTVEELRREMMERLHVPDHLRPAVQRQELGRRLRAWHHQVRLEDFVSQPLEDFGSLGSLQAPLRFFRDAPAVKPAKLERLLAGLYAKLYRQQLRLPPDRAVPELDATLALTRQAWQRALRGDSEAFARRRAQVERKTRAAYERNRRKEQKERIEILGEFLEAVHDHLAQARKAGCQRAAASPTELEAHLTLLLEVAQVASRDEHLRREFERHRARLHRDVQRLQAATSQCPPESPDPWHADFLQACRDLMAHLQRALSEPGQARAAGGG